MEINQNMPVIRLNNFTFSYPSAPACIGPINWEVEQGEFALLTGATGSGKTTLLRCLKPEIAPVGNRNGSIEIFGHAIEQGPTENAARERNVYSGNSSECSSSGSAALEHNACRDSSPEFGIPQTDVGFVFQNPETQIVCDTVWHELAFGLESAGVGQALMRRRVAEVANFFGITTWIDAQTDELSGGQKQLVNLASILALQPKILLLDEPTSQLDPVAKYNFLHELFRLNKELGITIVMATHEPEYAREYATCEVVLENGEAHRREKVYSAGKSNVLSKALSLLQVPSPAKNVEASEIALCMKDCWVAYERNASFVLRGLDFMLEQGKTCAIVGGNGSGKSTLLAAVAGVLKAPRGKIINKHKQSQAFLPQDPKALFACDTVEEELKAWQVSAGYFQDDIDAIVGRFHLEEAYLSGLHPYDLSGGQQQMLALAKLLLAKPALLLIDEPTKGLDASTKLEFANALAEEKRRGTSIVIATHDLEFALVVADEVAMLFDGQIVCKEPPAQFFNDNLFYKSLPSEFLELWARQQEARGRGANINNGECGVEYK